MICLLRPSWWWFSLVSFAAVLWEGVARGVLMTPALPPSGAPAPWAPPHSGAAPPPIWATPWPGGRGRNWATPSPPYSGPPSPHTKIRNSRPTSSPSPKSSGRRSSVRWAETAECWLAVPVGVVLNRNQTFFSSQRKQRLAEILLSANSWSASTKTMMGSTCFPSKFVFWDNFSK